MKTGEAPVWLIILLSTLGGNSEIFVGTVFLFCFQSPALGKPSFNILAKH